MLSDAFEDGGFTVETVLDADRRQLKEAIRRYGDRLLEGGPTSVGLFYFAGHGAQSEGVNFLVPSGAVIQREADLDLEAVSAQSVLSQIKYAGVSTNIIILDACRNMPFERSTRVRFRDDAGQ